MLETLAKVDYLPFYISLKLALITTIILFVLMLPLAYIVARKNFYGKALIETIFSLPLVLPPSVLGFYLLVALSPRSTFGKFMIDHFDIHMAFNFTGLIIGSCVYSLPFMFQPLVSGFRSMPSSLVEASYSLGKGRIHTLLSVALPNIRPNVINALVISFAHTLGEFGVVLFIGGNIGKETRVASIAIYNAVEELKFDQAHVYSAIMVAISFLVLFLVYAFGTKRR